MNKLFYGDNLTIMRKMTALVLFGTCPKKYQSEIIGISCLYDCQANRNAPYFKIRRLGVLTLRSNSQPLFKNSYG
jgi:hypothetical protein